MLSHGVGWGRGAGCGHGGGRDSGGGTRSDGCFSHWHVTRHVGHFVRNCCGKRRGSGRLAEILQRNQNFVLLDAHPLVLRWIGSQIS